VLPARKMTLIRGTRFTEALAGEKIDFDHSRMELWYLSQIHAERPHRVQWRVDDDFLLRSERWAQILPPNQKVV